MENRKRNKNRTTPNSFTTPLKLEKGNNSTMKGEEEVRK